MTGGDRGRRLMVTCNLSFSTFWLAPRLGALLAAHPWLSLNLSTPIWDQRQAEGVPEVEIRFGRAALMPGTAQRLAVERAYPVCAPDAEPEAKHWETAPLFDCTGVTANWEAWLSSQGFGLPRGRSVTLASTYVVSMTAALNGGGLAMAHDTLARDLLAGGRLERPSEHSVEMPDGYFLLAAPKHEETPAARTFVAWIAEEFALSG
ncbi:MAG: LysR substrate-binding domain-containing protein [Rhodospirillaceae bacterium]|nr:LysR substrate-binding domain-containing protein [Rhodospirillaceae bacterium]MDE0704752.1 LysR substrate-binding domain-containing protein [Rhodospirillaceae bacterium]